MRAWMLLLCLVGLGTAAVLTTWDRRGSDAPEGSREDSTESLDLAGSGDGPELVAEAPAVVEAQSLVAARGVPDAAGVSSVSTELADADQAIGGDLPDPEGEVDPAADRPGGSEPDSRHEARRSALALVERAASSSDPVEQARLLTTAIVSAALESDTEERAYAALLEANRRGLLNPRSDDGCMRIEVRSGDSLWAICRRARKESDLAVAPGLIRLVNGLASDAIYPGQRLKIPIEPLSIVVEKSRFRLMVLVGATLIKRYDVGLGKDNRTPEGQFTIATRLKDPPWFKPGTGPIPADDPENILGSRWLGFAAKEGFPEAATFGIHGTRDVGSIGLESSNGCVRMRNHDVEELFEWTSEGAIVRIDP